METSDGILSKEQRELVNKLTEEQLSKIDSMILSQAMRSNRKVAMIVGLTMMALPERIDGIPDIFYAQRVKVLVDKGALIAEGDLNRMRSSEVRLP
ncbi:MAG: hypothetical protein JKX81_11455 [Arenicella sp.]|nr:hypothetical protein [Arenicella sp.]